VVGLAKWLPLAVFAIPAGALADRVDRKRLMIACDAVRMIGDGSIVAMLVISAPSYGQILLVAFVNGALFTTSYVSERGALRQVVPTEHVQDAVAQNETRSSAASIAGPPLGGVSPLAGHKTVPRGAPTPGQALGSAHDRSSRPVVGGRHEGPTHNADSRRSSRRGRVRGCTGADQSRDGWVEEETDESPNMPADFDRQYWHLTGPGHGEIHRLEDETGRRR
jgi:hypothetical protein